MLTFRVAPLCRKVHEMNGIKCLAFRRYDWSKAKFTILRRFIWVYLDGQTLEIAAARLAVVLKMIFEARIEWDSIVLNFDNSAPYIIIIFSFTTSSSSHKVYILDIIQPFYYILHSCLLTTHI